MLQKYYPLEKIVVGEVGGTARGLRPEWFIVSSTYILFLIIYIRTENFQVS